MPALHYLVTGGAGFLGASLVRRLVREGHRVRVLDNLSRGSVGRLIDVRGDLEMVTADIRDAEAVRQAVKGVSRVCHLAAVNGTEFFYSKPHVVLDVAVRGMVHVVDACIQEGVGELFVASSSEVYQTPPVIPTPEEVPLVVPDVMNPRFSYGGGKIISELMAMNFGRKFFRRVVVFRPHNVYGPDMGWEHVLPQFVLRMRDLARSPDDPVLFPIQGTGRETRSFMYIDDFIEGLSLLLEAGKHLGVYHVGTMEEVTMESLAQMVGGYFGKRVRIVPSDLRKGSTVRRCPDNTRLVGLGFRAGTSLTEGVSRLARWYDLHADQRPKGDVEGMSP